MEGNNQSLNIGGIVLDILYFILGLLLVVVNSNTILSIIFTILGIFIILINIIPLVYFIDLSIKDKKFIPYVIYEILLIVTGVLVITLWSNPVVSIIAGVCLISYPVVSSLRKKESWVKAIVNNIPYIMLGILLFFIPASSILAVVIKVIGILIMIYSLFLIIMRIIVIYKINNESKNHIDSNTNNHNDDNTIDAEFKDLN